MEIILTLFGEGNELNSAQMGLRAFSLYVIALILIRISGIRTFGKKSTFDNVVTVLLGAVLSRAVVGASPFWPTVSAGLVLVLFHRLIAWLCLHYYRFGTFVNGEAKVLYRDGELYTENMQKNLITDGDLLESVRLQTNSNSLESIKEIYLERSGRISIIKKDS